MHVIIASNLLLNLAYAKEPHSSRSHKYKESIYKSSNIMTLQEAVNLAVEFSPQLKASKAGVMAAKGIEKQAGYWKNPELEIEAENIAGSGQFSGSDSAEYTYGLSQTIEIGGKRSARKKSAFESRKVANSEFTINKLYVIRDVHNAYGSVLAEAEALKLAKEQEELARQVLKSVSKRVAAARESEIQRVKATVAYDASVIKSFQEEGSLKSAKQKLAQLLGKEVLDVSLEHSYFFNLTPPKPLKSYQDILDKSPILNHSRYLNNEKKFNLDLARANRISDPTIKVGFRDFRDSSEQAMVAGLSFPLPLFDRNQGNVYSARAELSKASSNKLQTKLALEQKLMSNWQNWQSSFSTAKKLKESIIPTAKKAFRIARQGYQKGKLPYLEVLDAQRTLFNARESYHEALKNYHTYYAEVQAITNSFNNNLK